MPLVVVGVWGMFCQVEVLMMNVVAMLVMVMKMMVMVVGMVSAVRTALL